MKKKMFYGRLQSRKLSLKKKKLKKFIKKQKIQKNFFDKKKKLSLKLDLEWVKIYFTYPKSIQK